MRRGVLIGVVLIVLAGVAALVLWRPSDPESSPRARTSSETASHANEASMELAEEVSARDAREEERTAVVAPPSTANATLLRVLVVEEGTQQPIARWRVRLHPDPLPKDGWGTSDVDSARGSERESPITGADGRVEIVCTPGTDYVASAHSQDPEHEGRPTEARVEALSVGETRELVLEVRTRLDIVFFVRVLDRESRAPIASASVRVRSSSGWRHRERGIIERPRDDRVLTTSTTDAHGLARFELRSWDRPYLDVEGRGIARAFGPIDGGHATAETALDMLVARSARLDGTLHGATGGEILLRTHGYELVPADLSGMLVPLSVDEAYWTAPIAADGRFLFESLPPGCELNAEYWPVQGKPQRIGEPVTLAPGEERVVAWQLEGVCTIRGRMLDSEGAPVGLREVWLITETSPFPHDFQRHVDADKVVARARTDTKGTFEFAQIRPGKYQVGPAVDLISGSVERAHGIAGLSERVEVLAGDTLKELVLRVDRDLFITGKVVGPGGVAVAHAYVRASGLERQGFYSHNASEGSFRIGPLIRGRYRLSASGQEHAPSEDVDLEAGASGIVLELRSGASIEGRVVDDSGTPPPYEIQLTPAPGTKVRFSMMATTTDAQGGFALNGLEPGTYDLVASTSGGRYGVMRGVKAIAGEATKDVLVKLAPGARLRIRSSFSGGFLFVRSSETLIHQLEPDPKSPVECSLPPGRVRVELGKYVQRNERWELETIASTEVELAPDETKELTLDAPK